MRNAAELLQDVLDLPPQERERLALLAWESLEASFNPDDMDGDELALKRDEEIKSGKLKPISHAEFLRATGGAGE